jgi:hypothetical protein
MLFILDHCSRSAAGSFSPVLPQSTDYAEQVESAENSEQDEDENDSDGEQEIAVEKSVERILEIVNMSAKKRNDRKAAARAARSNDRQQHLTQDAGECTLVDADYGADLSAENLFSEAEEAAAATVNAAPMGSIRDMVVARVLSILNTGTYEEVRSFA